MTITATSPIELEGKEYFNNFRLRQGTLVGHRIFPTFVTSHMKLKVNFFFFFSKPILRLVKKYTKNSEKQIKL